MRIRYFLYNAFIVEDLGIKLAIDPGQNLSLFKSKNLIPKSEWKGVTHIAVTHGDPDHFVFAIAMAKESNAAVVCGETLTEDFSAKNMNNIHSIKVGGTVNFENIKFEGLIAKHGPLPVKLLAGLFSIKGEVAQGDRGGIKISLGPFTIFKWNTNMQVYSLGTIKLFFGLIKLEKNNIDFARGSVGFKITIGNKIIVNLGDTILQKEWLGIKPDVLMIPIGGRVIGNTMDEDEALAAVKLIEPKIVIPCHYNCGFLWRKNANPADDQMFKRAVEKLGITCHIMKAADAVDI